MLVTISKFDYQMNYYRFDFQQIWYEINGNVGIYLKETETNGYFPELIVLGNRFPIIENIQLISMETENHNQNFNVLHSNNNHSYF